MVHHQDRHRGVELTVPERQRLGDAAHDLMRAGALADHLERRLDGHDTAVTRLVAARAGPDCRQRGRLTPRYTGSSAKPLPNATEGYGHRPPASHTDSIKPGEDTKKCLTHKQDSLGTPLSRRSSSALDRTDDLMSPG